MTSDALATPLAVHGDRRRRSSTEPLQPVADGAILKPTAMRGVPELEVASDARIMMVDDEPTTTEILQMFLQGAGYSNFVTTNDSSTALATMTAEQPDVVLLDLMMPDVGGFDILEAMREIDDLAHIPVIMLTSSVDAETKLRALELGATDFLGKPVDPSELALRLRNTLTAKAHRDRLALYDSLTGLPNRALFEKRFERSLAAAARDARYCAVMLVDLNRFQKVNESLGHGMGDMLLKAVAQRIEGSLMLGDVTLDRIPREDPFVARLGGDEFAVVLPDMASIDNISHIAEQVRKAFKQPFVLVQEEIFVSASIGIAMSPHDGTEGDVLLQRASSATTYAKQKGLKQHQFYASNLTERVSESLRLESLLHMAVEREQLEVFYQPKIRLEDGQVVGAETLLRWKLPEIGYVSPGEFIPIAEESGLIIPIGEKVLREACNLLCEWETSGYGSLRLAVNVSAVQFRDAGFLDTLRDIVRAAAIDPKRLTIEITESVLMENVAESARTLDAIRQLGPKVSIDDFGTGYSSLAYLKRFAIDELKIDRSFLRDVPQQEDNCAIVNAVLGLAQALKLTCVAEGIETPEQFAYLRERGCWEFQGFIASKPVPLAEFTAFVDANGGGWRP